MQIRDWLKTASDQLQLPNWQLLGAYENVIMDQEDYRVQTKKIGFAAVLVEAGHLGRCRRPRLYWLRGFDIIKGVDVQIKRNVNPRGHSYHVDEVVVDTERPPLEWFLEPGAQKGAEPDDVFPTFTRTIPRQKPPDEPAGISECSAKALA